jgi:hypothetical protein
MNTSLKKFMVIYLLGFGCVVLGCQGTIWQCKRPQQDVRHERFVRIGGRVNNPGRVDLDSAGLTLRQGLQLASVSRNEAMIASAPTNADAIANTAIKTTSKSFHDCASELVGLLGPNAENPPGPQIMRKWEDVISSATEFFNASDIGDIPDDGPVRASWKKIKSDWEDEGGDLPKYKSNPSDISCERLLKKMPPIILELDEFIKLYVRLNPKNFASNILVSAVGDVSQLISLRRNSSGRIQTYFFPYSFVMNGDAGGIALEHGDFIAAVPISESPLNLREAVDGPVSVAGYVKNGGDFEPAKVGNRNVGDVLNYAGTIEGVEYGMISCVLTRFASNGDGMVTIIAPAPHSDSFAREILVSGGDQISFTPTPLAPLIVNSFLSGSARNTISDEVVRRKSSATGLRKAAQSAQQCADQIGQQTRKGFSQILNGQVPSMTSKSKDSTNNGECAISARTASR